jgi:hypothetical protein
MSENRHDTLEGGARDVILSSWQEFHQKVGALRSKRGYVWRGQKKDWPLLSSFDRRVQSKDRRDRDQKLKHHLGSFRDAMNELYPDVLRQDGDDIWALGQHYGLWTPLLDWTTSPYIAAYFAFDERVDEDDRSD